MTVCPNCRAKLAPSAVACAACGASFEGADGWRPLEAEGAFNSPVARHSWWLVAPTFILLFTMVPAFLAFAGFGLKELLGCEGGVDRVASCASAAWAVPIVTFLTIYCGWAMVFTVPVGALVALVFSVVGSR